MQTVIHIRGFLYYRCPGCKSEHSVPVLINKKEANHWNWNGDLIKPTVRPSVRHFHPDSAYEEHPNMPKFCCHYHITDGVLEYFGDSTHADAGKNVPMTVFSETEVTDISKG